jgi:hypothetical protein
MYDTVVKSSGSILVEKRLDNALGQIVFAFAEVVITNSSLSVDEVICGPVFVAEAGPDQMVTVDGDGVSDVQVRHSSFHLRWISLEAELWRMNTDYHQAGILILCLPGFYIR